MARSKKSGTAIILAPTLFVEFLSNVFKMVKKLGGNEQAIYNFFSSPNGAEETAELIVSKMKKFSQSLSGLISALKLDLVNSDITEERFPTQPEDSDLPKEYEAFSFGLVSSVNAVAGMEKEGFRPATLREMLVWALKNWDRRSLIVALGSRWPAPGGGTLVPVLNRRDAECGLYLDWLGVSWDCFYLFLGVRK